MVQTTEGATHNQWLTFMKRVGVAWKAPGHIALLQLLLDEIQERRAPLEDGGPDDVLLLQEVSEMLRARSKDSSEEEKVS